MTEREIILASAKGELRDLETDENLMILINQENSDVVERLIAGDENYAGFNETRRLIQAHKDDYEDLDEEQCFKIVNQIARENSTRTSKVNCRLFAKYMIEHDFFEKVKEGKIEIVEEMLKGIKEYDSKARRDKSLASKVCKYFNTFLFERNDFSINDSFVRSLLPYYLKQYEVDESLWKTNKGKIKNLERVKYDTFISLISELEAKIKIKSPNLNKNLIDHVMWYGYKSDSIRFEIAKQLGKLS